MLSVKDGYCAFFFTFPIYLCSKIVELEEELRIVGNNLKSLEVSEEKVSYEAELFQNGFLFLCLFSE